MTSVALPEFELLVQLLDLPVPDQHQEAVAPERLDGALVRGGGVLAVHDLLKHPAPDQLAQREAFFRDLQSQSVAAFPDVVS